MSELATHNARSHKDETSDTVISAIPPATAGGALFKKRTKAISAQKGLRRPVPVPSSAPAASSSDDEDDSDEGSSGDERGSQKLNVAAGRKRKRGGLIQAESARTSTTKGEFGVSYDANKSSGSSLDPRSQATSVSAAFSDAELLGKKTGDVPMETPSDNLYHGQKNYRTLVQKREQVTTKYNSMGPQKAASNIRMTTVTDYAPGISGFLLNAS